jgi:GNAT superfamily N-acetyltransferase
MSTNILLDTNTLTQNHTCADANNANDASSYEEPKGKKMVANLSHDKMGTVRAWGHKLGLVSSRIFLAIPETNNETLNSFLNAYESRLNALAAGWCAVKRKDNYVGMSSFVGDHVFQNGRKETCFVADIGDNATFLIEHRETKQFIASISFRMFGQSNLELSRIIINDSARGKGLGTELVNIAKRIVETMNLRLLLFPSPPLAEIENQGWIHDYQLAAAKEKLICWYAKRGFVLCHPEYIDVIRVSGDKKMRLGICGLMAYRQAEEQVLAE